MNVLMFFLPIVVAAVLGVIITKASCQRRERRVRGALETSRQLSQTCLGFLLEEVETDWDHLDLMIAKDKAITRNMPEYPDIRLNEYHLRSLERNQSLLQEIREKNKDSNNTVVPIRND